MQENQHVCKCGHEFAKYDMFCGGCNAHVCQSRVCRDARGEPVSDDEGDISDNSNASDISIASISDNGVDNNVNIADSAASNDSDYVTNYKKLLAVYREMCERTTKNMEDYIREMEVRSKTPAKYRDEVVRHLVRELSVASGDHNSVIELVNDDPAPAWWIGGGFIGQCWRGDIINLPTSAIITLIVTIIMALIMALIATLIAYRMT